MKTCPSCKSSNPDDAKYCHICGNKLRGDKILELLKKYRIIVIGLLGMILVTIGSFISDGHLVIGVSFLLIGALLMIWAYFKGKNEYSL